MNIGPLITWIIVVLGYLRDKMKNERWISELISVKGKEELGEYVSHETLYKYLW